MTRIAVLKESAAGETRVAATAETVRKFIALGASVAVETGAGVAAAIADADYAAAGATLGLFAVFWSLGGVIALAVPVAARRSLRVSQNKTE